MNKFFQNKIYIEIYKNKLLLKKKKVCHKIEHVTFYIPVIDRSFAQKSSTGQGSGQKNDNNRFDRS